MGNGPNPEEVWTFLKWMQKPENIQEWCLISGAFSPRKSQSDYNSTLVTDRFGVTGDVFNYCLAHSTMVNSELRQYGNPNEREVKNYIAPFFDEMNLGRITAEEFAESIVDEATRIAQQPC
jgi:ABC-type glycerol-3-phosphate transport system substrate-binding protein